MDQVNTGPCEVLENILVRVGSCPSNVMFATENRTCVVTGRFNCFLLTI